MSAVSFSGPVVSKQIRAFVVKWQARGVLKKSEVAGCTCTQPERQVLAEWLIVNPGQTVLNQAFLIE